MTTTTRGTFDDSQLSWSRLGDEPMFDHMVFHALSADEERNHVEFLVKFDANEMILLHRHLADTNTLVVAGEHILYEKDRSKRDARPAGRFTTSPAGDVHREGGGPDGAIVHYSVRGESDALFDLLDEDEKVVLTLRTADVLALLAGQAANA